MMSFTFRRDFQNANGRVQFPSREINVVGSDVEDVAGVLLESVDCSETLIIFPPRHPVRRTDTCILLGEGEFVAVDRPEGSVGDRPAEDDASSIQLD